MPQTLLLADDSVTIQRVIELTFADQGIAVVAVSDGDQAIARLDQAPPDIVLADVAMPGKNGYEVAKYVKQTPRLAHIPVVLLTGAFEPVDQAKVAAVGCDGVLAKPFEPQLVIGRVRELLGRPAQPVAPSDPAAFDLPLATPAAGTGRLDDYFDRLDAAFASVPKAPNPDVTPAQPARSAPEAIGWFGLETRLDRTAVRDTPRAPAASPVTPVAPPAAVPDVAPLPTLADAFAALLAAEQNGPAPAARPAWPAPAASNPPVSEDLVEEISRRVAARLADQVVREIAADRVSEIAERLVREEIQRIKDSVASPSNSPIT